MVNTSKGTFRQILHQELNIAKVCAQMVPRNLTQDQKDNWKYNRSDFIGRLKEEKDLLTIVFTSEEI